MLLNSRQLARVPVRTQSGTRLGKLASVDIDADTGRISAIRVIPLGAVIRLLGTELIIGWAQIVSMTTEEIVVKDGSVPYAAAQLAAVGSHD